MSLLRQAHVEGYLDCREARTFDRNWQLKVTWTLNWLEKKNRNELRRLSHELNCALLDYFAGDKAVDLHWEQAHVLQRRTAKALLPWEKFKAGRFSRQTFKSLKDQWKAIFGDPEDPEVAERIKATVTALLSRSARRGE